LNFDAAGIVLHGNVFLLAGFATLAALLFGALPATLAAVWISELAPTSVRSIARTWFELIATLPAVVWGSAVAWIFAEPLRSIVHQRAVADAISCAVALSCMMVPTTVHLVNEKLQRVPQELRDTATALGASPWQTAWHAVVPSARSGVVAAVALSAARALGEVVALCMVVATSGIPQHEETIVQSPVVLGLLTLSLVAIVVYAIASHRETV
jgi:phosphate transport system permease protein